MDKKRKIIIQWITISLATILPVAFIATYSLYEFNKIIKNNIYKERISTAYLSASLLKEKFDRLKDIGGSIATRVKFRQYVSEGKWEKATEILKDIPKDFTSIDRIFLTDTLGILRGDVPEAIPSVRGQDFSYRDWYRGVKEHWTPYVSEVYKRKAIPRSNVVSIAIPIKSGIASQVVEGIIVLQIRTDTLLKWSNDIVIGDEGRIYFIDQKGQTTGRPEHNMSDSIIDYSSMYGVEKALKGEKGIGEYYNPGDNEKWLVAYHPITGHGWGVLIQQPYDKAFVEGNKNMKLTAILYGFILTTSLFFAFLLLRNMIKRMRTEEEMKKNAAELKLLNKELEQFVFVASHDLQEPLRTISNFVSLIDSKYTSKIDAEADQYLKFIMKATSKMQNLIKDLLDYSRATRSVSFTEVDCNLVVKEVLSDMDATMKESKAEIQYDELPVVYGNETGLKRLFQNLISNAIKFHKKNNVPMVSINVSEHESEYLFSVKDNGIGVEERYFKKLFVIFQRLNNDDEDYPGTGIGLATCQKIVNIHGGKIWLESKLGEGSTFYFTLPKK